MAGVLVTVFRDDGRRPPVGFEATTDADGALRVLRPRARRLEGAGRAARLLPLPHHRDHRRRRARRRHLLRRARLVQPVRRHRHRRPRPRKEVSRTVITAEEIDKIPGAAGDPLAVVQNFAGVARTPLAGLLIVRGSAPEDTRSSSTASSPAHLPLRRPAQRDPGRHARQHRVLPGQLLADVRPRHRRHHRRAAQEAAAQEGRRLRRRQPPRHRRLPRGAARRQGRHRGRRPAQLHRLHPQRGGARRRRRSTWSPRPATTTTSCSATTGPRPAHDLRALLLRLGRPAGAAVRQPGRPRPDARGQLVLDLDHLLPVAAHLPLRAGRAASRTPCACRSGRDLVRLQAPASCSSTSTSTARSSATPPATSWPTALALVRRRSTSLFEPDRLHRRSCRCRPRRASRRAPFDLDELDHAPRATTSARLAPAGFVEARAAAHRPACCCCPGCASTTSSSIEQTIAQPRLTARWQLATALHRQGRRRPVRPGAASSTRPTRSSATRTCEAERALHYSLGVEFKPRPWLTLDVTGFYKRPAAPGQPRPTRRSSRRTGCRAR